METLVKKDTAILAKEKGFNVPTYSNCWVKTLNGEIIHNSERKDIAVHDRCETYLRQPSLFELQTWLRNNGVDVWVTTGHSYNDKKEKNEKHYLINIHHNWIKGMLCGMGHFTDYNKAFEVGLQEGLKKLQNSK